MNIDKSQMLLYAVTDHSWVGEQTLYEQIEAALAGGITCLQLREKNLPYDEFLKEATEVKKLCCRYGVPLIINDNPQIAIESSADGVHIGQDDADAAEVRKLIGDKMILGVSAHNKAEAIAAYRSGADYLGSGAAFGSSTKADAHAIDRSVIKEICRSADIPVVAIGGITKDNMPLLADTGISGVALVSAIFASRDIESECKYLKRLAARTVGYEF